MFEGFQFVVSVARLSNTGMDSNNSDQYEYICMYVFLCPATFQTLDEFLWNFVWMSYIYGNITIVFMNFIALVMLRACEVLSWEWHQWKFLKWSEETDVWNLRSLHLFFLNCLYFNL
jgi:hypothetical protein